MTSDFLEALGGRVREMRKDRGLTQEGFATRAGLDRAFMGRVERGAQNVTVITAARIASALDASLEELVRGLPRYDARDEERPD